LGQSTKTSFDIPSRSECRAKPHIDKKSNLLTQSSYLQKFSDGNAENNVNLISKLLVYKLIFRASSNVITVKTNKSVIQLGKYLAKA
jgi:hypothetical protein